MKRTRRDRALDELRESVRELGDRFYDLTAEVIAAREAQEAQANRLGFALDHLQNLNAFFSGFREMILALRKDISSSVDALSLSSNVFRQGLAALTKAALGRKRKR